MTYVLVVVRFRIQNWLLTCDEQDENFAYFYVFEFTMSFEIKGTGLTGQLKP